MKKARMSDKLIRAFCVTTDLAVIYKSLGLL
jgi:hypothetical protein